MKKLFFVIIGLLTLCMVACSNTGRKAKEETQQIVKQEQKKREFKLPEVPVMLNTPELRATYVAQHYWDHFDFRDTAYIHLPDITEQAAVDYMDLLQRIPKEDALEALSIWAKKASVEPRMIGYLWEVLYRYWHNPNSPMKNEDMFILLCKGVEQTSEVEEYLRERAAYLRELAEMNRPGMKANDFVYTLDSGKQGRLYSLKAEYTLLFFYDPDCETCAEIKQMMKHSLRLKDMISGGRIKVLTIYPDENIELWRERLFEMSDEWINGYDKGQVLNLEQRYDLSAMPSLYLLDKDKKVLLKDADWREILHFFENK